jgi:hypothetical protein
MTDGMKKAVAGAVVATGTGYVIKKARPVIYDSVPPLAAAALLAALGAFVAGILTPPVNRLIEGLAGPSAPRLPGE